MSGRRAAENTNTTPNDARCIWLTREQRDAVDRLSRESRDTLVWGTLRPVVDAWDAAPADPAEAVRIACLTSLDGFVSHAHIGQVHDAVLVALGLRRQDNPTQEEKP